MARDTRICRLTIDGSGVTWKLVTIARQPRPDTATSCSICNFIIWFHDRAASWCQSIITRDSHPDKFAVCPTAHPLHLSIQYLLNIYTQYLHNIYTVSTQYLHSIYTISTQYLHCIYNCIFSPGTVTLTSLLSVLVVEGRRASCTSPSHHQPTPRISSQLLTVVTSPPSSLGLSKPGSSCTPEPRDDCTDKRPDCRL